MLAIRKSVGAACGTAIRQYDRIGVRWPSGGSASAIRITMGISPTPNQLNRIML